jgi:hypothetical protein
MDSYIEYPYKSLKDTLQKIYLQGKKDINWIRPKLPNKEPELLFYWLSSQIVYQDDPPDTELIQSPKTLFLNNWYGVPGMGDCDCFTALTICVFLAAGFTTNELGLVITGKDKIGPCHIYTQINGIPFDLTNAVFGYERKYPFHQVIPLPDLINSIQ